MSIEAGEFRRVLSHFASGVTVITTRHEDQVHGTTVSAFCSLSLDPPLVLVCLDHTATIYNLIAASGTFGVNILSEHDEHLSRHFARRGLDKFVGISHMSGQTGVPLLENALATLECRVRVQYAGGDHTIVVGEVVAVHARSQGHPLLFFRSTYGRLRREPDPLLEGSSAANLLAHAHGISSLASGAASFVSQKEDR